MTKAEIKKQRMLERKEKKQVNPMGRVTVGVSGVKIEHKGNFVFLEDSADLIEKIVQCARVELTDNQIISALKIKKEDFLSEVQNNFKNSGNMNFLIGLLPNEIHDYKDMKANWNQLKEDITKMLKEEKQVEEIAAKYGRDTEEIYR